MNAGIAVADLKVADALDRLYVMPRAGTDPHRLRQRLEADCPGLGIKRSHGALWVAAAEAHRLLEVTEIALRWTGESRRFAENRRRARLVHPTLRAEVARVLAAGAVDARRSLGAPEVSAALDDHQAVNVAAMAIPTSYGLCLFDEQGLGKTVTVIFAYDLLVARDQIDFCLVVAPKSMVPEWPHDFGRFKPGLYSVKVAAGSRREKRQTLASRADVVVTNFETAVSMESELRALLRASGDRAMMVIDESFFAKSLDAKRTRAIRRLREWCGRAFVLCGTPAPNAPEDLVQQFNLVDFGLTFDGIVVPEDRQSQHRVVKQAMEERGAYIRHLKSEALPDLPSRRCSRLLVPLAPEQYRLYSAALERLVADLRIVDDEAFRRRIASFMGQRSTLLQICSNPASVAPGYVETPAKLGVLDQVLEELSRRREKAVIWSFYVASIEALVNRYGRYKPVRYDGTVTDTRARREAVRRFQEDGDCMLFIANPAAAGAGLTLHRARIAIYESMSNQAAHYLQSLDRIHRRGQTREVEYLIILCDKTIEVSEYDRLIAKDRSAKSLLGDPEETAVTREAMLAEALSLAGVMGEIP